MVTVKTFFTRNKNVDNHSPIFGDFIYQLLVWLEGEKKIGNVFSLVKK